ncbi:hypothetical protein [Chitinophaga sp. MM2321]|uniref:hypothetical protein n=1 Tax=Chitinophaga sp. MM2321 TaxID=3137178 RepID=UPI0032D59368
MYIPLIIFIAFISWYIIFRIRTIREASLKENRYKPIPGEDAIAAAKITGVDNSAFTVSKYMRSVKNTSDHRFMTLAIIQIIKTTMGTTRQARLIESLAPGEERRLGHSDNVTDGKRQIFIGYEVLWARYIPTPKWYTDKMMLCPLSPELYCQILKHYHPALLAEMEQQANREDEQQELWS